MPEPTSTRVSDTPAASLTHQDLQRIALRDLIALAGESAAREADIERRHRTAADACAKEREKTAEDIEHRYQSLKANIEARYAEFVDRVETQYRADLEKLSSAEKSAVGKLDHESATVDRDVRQKLAQATWLAESVFEASQNQITADTRADKEEFTARKQIIEGLDHRAEVLMRTYGEWWESTEAPPAETEESDTTAPEPVPGADEHGVASDAAAGATEPDAAPGFDEACEQAQEALARLGELRLPKLFVGVLPFVLGLVVCACVGIVTQLVTGQSTPQWKPIGISTTATLAVLIAAGVVFRNMARAQVAECGSTLREAILATRRAAHTEHDRKTRERKQRARHAVAVRDREVKQAKDHYIPIIERAKTGRSLSLQSIEEERTRLVPRIEAQRELGLKEAEEWKQRAAAELEQGHDRELGSAAEKQERRTAEIEDHLRQARRDLERSWTEGLTRIQAPIGSPTQFDGRFPEWGDAGWADWAPPREFASIIRFGRLGVDLPTITSKYPQKLELPPHFAVPALLAFPRQASLLIHTDHAGRADAVRTLQNVMVRLLTSMPPGRIRFTIIDPTGLGQNFAGFMHLADYDESLVGSRIWTDEDHIEARLADLTEHMETVIQKYLRNEFETIDDYNAQAGELAEPYRFLAIADFPVNFSDTAVRRLNSIASTGARCGVYTLVVRDIRQSLPAGAHIDELETHSVNLVRENNRFAWRDPVFKQFPLDLDVPPSEEFLTRILHVVGRGAKESKRVEVPFTTITPALERMWTGNTGRDIEVPIGRMGATRLQTLRLGRGVAQHALLAGKTGSGKSTLLHVLITNVALWYSPEEVEFYLVDFKKGVEFKAYAEHALPHARAIAVESDREFGLSVLQRVDAELGHRGALFRKEGVQDLAAYRETTGRKLPRTLLVIDEFQEFFSEDDKLAQDAGLLLDRLVRQGRAFGIHVLLGSQTVGGTSGLARSTLGQMAVRIALQTTEADSQIILGDGNSAARLLSRPGEAIYNDAGGLVEVNSPFQVAWLSDETRDQFLDVIRKRTLVQDSHLAPHPNLLVRESLLAPTFPEAVVFEGNAPGILSGNRELGALLAGSAKPNLAAPKIWLGEPVAIKDPTAVTLRRQSGANVLIIGQQDDAAMGLMNAAMLSLAAQHPVDGARFEVLDGSPADSPLAAILPRMKSVLPQSTRLIEYRAVEETLQELGEELRRRQSADNPDPLSIYVILYGMQRYRALRRSEDSFSFSMGDEPKKPAADRVFAELLREGPPLGIHVIAWADTPAAVERTLDRGSLREFDNRILFQMSASDSSNLIDSPLANKLGPNRALAYSEEQGTLEKFRPYAIPAPDWLEQVRNALLARK